MKFAIFLAACFGLVSQQALAQAQELIICSEPGDSRVVELDLNANVARVKFEGSSSVEVLTYTETDAGIMYFRGPVHVFDFSFRQGSQRGIGNANLADRIDNQTMWCKFAK